MKKTRKILCIAFLLCVLFIIYIYVCAINSIPQNIIIFQGEEINFNKLYGIEVEEKYQSVFTSSQVTNLNNEIGTKNVRIKLFDMLTVKEVGVSVIERKTVVPVGQIAGLKIYTNGVLVVGMSEIIVEDNNKCRPYENSGIKEGDMIIRIDEENIYSTNELIDCVNNSNGRELKFEYIRNGESFECNITPTKCGEDEYKIGLWVRDSAAGIGTMTYYDTNTKKFAALGHGITDVDTGELLNISNGDFITTKIISIIKGKEGNPGKIQGTIDNQSKIGTIYKNCNLGIYGIAENLDLEKIDLSKQMEVATRNDIVLGKAKIIASLDNEGPKEYDVEIEKIFLNNNYDNKSFFIKVTDKELIEKTGGIIQGMSGSPIIQNNKFVGAVTNVLVNDPIKGYGIFADLMMKEMEEVK